MGRRRTRVVRIVKPKLPTLFACPSCGEESVSVQINRSKKDAIVQCSACKRRGEFKVSPIDQKVDIYCKFTDRFHSERIESKPPTEVVDTEGGVQKVKIEQSTTKDFLSSDETSTNESSDETANEESINEGEDS